MQSSSLKRFAPWALGLGLVGLLAAAVVALLYQQFNTGVQVSLVLGLIGLVLAVLFNPGAVVAWFGGRQARFGSNALVMTLAFLGILILVNYLVVRNPVRWDLTEDQSNTLSPETLAALRALPAPVRAVGFYTTNALGQQQSAEELLKRYRAESQGNFTYEFNDPLGDPLKAREYNIARDATVILEMGSERQELSFVSETELTSALVRLANPTSRTLYFVTGQGEADPNDTGDNGLSQVVDLLKRQNYTIATLNLQVTDTVPADARAVIIAGPQLAYTQPAADTLSRYLAENADAALVVLKDPAVQTQSASGAADQPQPPDPLLTYLQTSWGVTLRDDVVVDLVNSAFTSQGQNPIWPVYADYPDSPVSERIQGVASVYPVARSLATDAGSTGVTFTPLVVSGGEAWGETDLESLSAQAQLSAGEGDTTGPVTLAVGAQASGRAARVVVFGDADFARNAFASTPSSANADLFVNAVNWAARDEQLINIVPKTATQRTLQLFDALTINAIRFVTLIAMPAAVLVLGGVVWFVRRRHK